MSGARGASWRDKAASALLLRHLPGLGIEGPVLVVGDPLPAVAEGISSVGLEVARWNRRAFRGDPASPWPPSDPFRTVAVRLPRAKEELAMVLHAGAAVMEPGGTTLVYGAKDEGIGSVARILEELHEGVEAVGVGGHCRVLRGKVKEGLQSIRGSLADWREEVSLEHPGLKDPWVSYPGVFAHGRLDPGTRLLLDALPALDPGAAVLDYGCGSGIVGGVIKSLYPQVRLTLLDVDALALEAAGENVLGARYLLGDGLPAAEGVEYDAILSNPPFHEGKGEDPGMILEVIRGAPAVLRPEGVLALVAQRRLPLEEPFRRAFKKVTILSEDGGFRVWEGRFPR